MLKEINSPKDLKKISRLNLPFLAEEVREEIIKTVAQNGGHLASNLGVVELTIALHYVFNLPDDKIIWDVGHQSYTHKLLTGRFKNFHTLRQHNGIAGFPKVTESKFDSFTTGHSSTSISAACGIAAAAKLTQKKSKTIAVIGDGSLTGGMAYEALNQVGILKKNLVVILNDNDMSISKNVGSLSSFLSRTLSSKYLQGMRNKFGNFLKSLPKIGKDAYSFMKRTEESFKAFVTPGMLFEAFNLDYFGPIDGHNLDHLIDILYNIKELDDPILLHIKTKKGKGFKFAEDDPVYFHGVSSFEYKENNKKKEEDKKDSTPTYTEIFGKTIEELAEKDNTIVAITAAMPEGTGLSNFSKKFPERFFDVGIAEQHGVTFAAGLAISSFKPVVAIYSTFIQRAYDQIVHDVCIESLPVVFAIDRAGIVGEDGVTHQGLFDISFLRCLPNIVIMAPKDENELKRMLISSFTYNLPVAVRYPRGQGVGVKIDNNSKPLEIGKAEIVKEGEKYLILSIGSSVYECLKATTLLKEKNIDPCVVNARFIKPLDENLIISLAKKFPIIITVEEHSIMGGFGSAVLECLQKNGVTNSKVYRIGIDDKFVEHGNQTVLREKYKLDAKGIAEFFLDLKI